MTKRKRILLGAISIALFSQLYLDILDVFIPHFRITCGIIVLSIFIYTNDDITGTTLGIVAAISTFLWNLLVMSAFGNFSTDAVIKSTPEIFFYLWYGFFIHLTVQKHKYYDFHLFFFLAVVFDWTANIFEVIIRVLLFNQPFSSDILTPLLGVAVIRSAVALICLIFLKYQKILILKEEHENRYWRLLWLNSFIRTEIFLMENNMARIEQVMTNAYKHFEDIRDGTNRNEWASDAITLAGSVHEIKKEYELVIRGVNDLMENKYQNKAMTFKSIISILEEQMKTEAVDTNSDIRLVTKVGSDFNTIKHFQLISIFRNLINNAFDAAKNSDTPVTISLSHWVEGKNHRFLVSDDGPGIDPDDLPLIQTPGFSTKINYQTGHINRGLGLTIVYRYVQEILEGSIKVESTPGKQTTFDITIPKDKIEVV
ncbi:two-component system, sensor histidine kinase YcbA [Dethiosulfatibacter aminovorans DSM 17477]|uniref:histidine kinase n=1 Tax=Dethiosulfatibacter aminovorans DSM 17477 TaxID=1121476 RepID=A0A1M6GMY6_9FIRM|nr:ATP-binding protein [Dethiosulfatibacter aminovorans]SHJ11260.1 two-component system, sensor histidine kinase YcbA [Dethiosulfatibacter aminovorans DSM 17477]